MLVKFLRRKSIRKSFSAIASREILPSNRFLRSFPVLEPSYTHAHLIQGAEYYLHSQTEDPSCNFFLCRQAKWCWTEIKQYSPGLANGDIKQSVVYLSRHRIQNKTGTWPPVPYAMNTYILFTPRSTSLEINKNTLAPNHDSCPRRL